MAIRPVFVSIAEPPFYETVNIEFEWSPGFAKSQSQKNITAIHNGFTELYPEYEILEISSKSLQDIGTKLSAFSLSLYVESIRKIVPVECVYQGSKIFENGGPYIDLYFKSPKEAKKDERLKKSGKLIGYKHNGLFYSLNDDFTFYDRIYFAALKENPSLADELVKYSAFTDIAFSPNKSLNCQAKSAAIYKHFWFQKKHCQL